MALIEVQVPAQDSLDFGVGVDSNTSSPMGKVVDGEIKGVAGADGAKVGYAISRIQTTHDLETQLGIDVNLSYGAASFGAGVSNRFNFATSSKIHSSSLFMAITARVTLASHSIHDPSLTPAAASLVDNPTNFMSRFGNMFVRGIGRGGLLVAVLKFDTSSEEDTQSISDKLKGSYGAFSGDAETKFNSIQQDFRVDISLQVYHEGGPVDLIPQNIEDPSKLFEMLKTWLGSFALDPDHAAVPYFAILAPTSIANGPLPLNAAEMENAQDVLVNCAKQRSIMFDNLNLMGDIILSPKRYSFAPTVTVKDVILASNGYQADLNVVAAAASAAMNHPASAMLPAAFAAANNLKFPQGIAPDPIPVLVAGNLSNLAERGKQIALADPLLTALREVEIEGPLRFGFDIGLAFSEGDSLQGPKKDNFKKVHVADFDSGAYQRAVDYTVDLDANAVLAARGIAVVASNKAAAESRSKLPPSNRWLGFDIAAGHFGASSDGGEGNTLQGSGSDLIRGRLSASTRLGWDAALVFFNIP